MLGFVRLSAPNRFFSVSDRLFRGKVVSNKISTFLPCGSVHGGTDDLADSDKTKQYALSWQGGPVGKTGNSDIKKELITLLLL